MVRDSSGMLNAYSGDSDIDGTTASLIERRWSLLGPAYRLFYEKPIHMVRGEGPWLFDAAGDRYLDAKAWSLDTWCASGNGTAPPCDLFMGCVANQCAYEAYTGTCPAP